MWIAVMAGNLPELFGAIAVAGVSFWLGRRYERRFPTGLFGGRVKRFIKRTRTAAAG